MTVLLCGIRSEPPLALVAAALARIGAPCRWFDQRRALSTTMRLNVDDGEVHGTFDDGDGPLSLESVRSVYVRTMDDRLLPEIEAEPPDSLARQGCRALHDQLLTWLEITPALVI